MKRLILAISLAAALAFSLAAVASAAITGKFSTTISKPASVKGKWTLTFKKNGSVSIARNGQTTQNTGSLKGTTFTAPGGKACPTVGTYKVKLSGKKLTFTVIKDSCKVGRKLILPGHTFVKVG
ncbi:MAG TPA: hypothetical protein VNZ05_05285 [Solirubrobacteraceae bacterium]|jgi:hypothetical protein|nr:hypothetical protein [Solirubrobacteraceae bacterium]